MTEPELKSRETTDSIKSVVFCYSRLIRDYFKKEVWGKWLRRKKPEFQLRCYVMMGIIILSMTLTVMFFKTLYVKVELAKDIRSIANLTGSTDEILTELRERRAVCEANRQHPYTVCRVDFILEKQRNSSGDTQ